MTDDREAVRRALAVLSEGVHLHASEGDSDARRTRVVGRLRTLNRRIPRERALARIGFAVSLAAAAGFAVFFGFRARSSPELASRGDGQARLGSDVAPLRLGSLNGSPSHAVRGRTERLAPGVSVTIDAPTLIETSAGEEARVEGGNGLDIVVREGSRVELQAKSTPGVGNELSLNRGAIDCSVDPRGVGPKLAIVTPDARVVVKGTIFSVEVLPIESEDSRTCVRVRRGIVGVTRGAMSVDVAEGQEFGCSGPNEEPAVAPGASKPTSGVTPGTKRSTLAEQNAAFARGLAAERAGRLDLAEAELSRLLQRYPDTLLRADIEATLARVRKNRGATP